MNDKEREKSLMKSLDLTKSGYAGIDRNGNKVDRREHPDATPMKENRAMEIPKPKQVKRDQ